MATVAKRLQVCRMIFKAAMRAKYIGANPFQGVSAPATVRADKFFFVTREMTQRLLGCLPRCDLAAVRGPGTLWRLPRPE